MALQTEVQKGGQFLIGSPEVEQVFTPEDFTEEHQMIAKTTADFVEKDVRPVLEEIEAHDFSHSVRLLKQAGELGLLGADVAEAHGGVGLDKISSALITENMAGGRSFGLSHGAHVGIGTLPIVFFGNEKQKQQYLPKLASGEWIAAYALTEPESGSDALGAKTTAKLSADGTKYILNGQKQWITNSAFADVFVVYAKVDGDKFTAFIVEKTFPGVSTGPEEKKMGIKGSSTRTLNLEDAEVPVENVLGEIGRGHVIAFNILNVGRYKLAVGCVGSSKRVLELSTKYAKERKQFKTPIASFPLIQQKLADMAIKTYAVESMVYRTGGLFENSLGQVSADDGQAIAKAIADYAIECSMNKVFGSEVLDAIVDEGVQIHGGYGFMQEYEVENAYRDSRINRIFEGTNEINRLLIPGTIMRKVMKGELPLLQEAQSLQEELLTFMPPMFDDPDTLEIEGHLIEMTRKIALMTAGLAVEKYAEKLEREQELLSDIADLVTALFAMEGCYLRAQKAIQTVGLEKASLHVDYTSAFVYDTFEEVEMKARGILAALEEGDMLRAQLAVLKKLTRYTPINKVALKRRIAAVIIEEEAYVCSK
ncbi:acyl-CoA dehydrogenase family protein [Numidum massiliense]|uniref:acyl-CoA dehydrogenase family protein n=1 Tax=Numidum massiliense TaxID=1522315 RepID=UPI0006D59EA5|nr:acyl-CoA dehydrogenase family protein [Numidum massiliense]